VGAVKIRRIDHDERLTTALPLQMYAFGSTPGRAEDLDRFRENLPYVEGNVTLVAEEDGAATAVVSAIPMRQNVRGTVYPMAGVAGVASHPLARRRGHVRALLTDLLGRSRDDGCAVSALYPFRPSFYEKFGYVGLPKARTVSFAPADLARLRTVDLPGEVRLDRIRDGYERYRELSERTLAGRHGFALFPDYQAAKVPDRDELWLATALVDGAVAGCLTYRIAGHAGDVTGGHLLSTGPVGRALLLRFLGQHVDQVARVVVSVAPDDYPELWLTDLATQSETRTAFPGMAAPMARVLSVPALAGVRVGAGRVAVEVVDDPFVAGRYVLDGTDGGVLAVAEGRSGALPSVTLTAAGLSGLVYGVLDPEDLAPRGFGAVPDPAAAAQLRALWPRAVPYLAVDF
jgi:predicted acetyltransferase